MAKNKNNKNYKHKTKEEADMFSLKTRARIIVKNGSGKSWKF